MQFHRLASLLIGIWLGISVFMDIVATQNFQTVNRVMTSLDLKVVETTRKIGDPESTRYLLRYFAGEANRFLFEQWEWAELMLGLVMLLVLLFCRSNQKIAMSLVLAMVCIVLAQRFKLTPAITTLGREIGFSATASRRFTAYHQAYGIIELLKIALGLGVAGSLLIRRNSGKRAFVKEYEREREVAARARKA
jgi:hypothetical protein